jgi:hypothetical protein
VADATEFLRTVEAAPDRLAARLPFWVTMIIDSARPDTGDCCRYDHP